MEKQFLTYIHSKAIKQLGFKEECLGAWHDVEVSTPFLTVRSIKDTQGGYFTLAPLYQQVFDWFREKQNIHAYIQRTYKEMDIREGFEFYFDNYDLRFVSDIYDTYEEARFKCIEKLIEKISSENDL